MTHLISILRRYSYVTLGESPRIRAAAPVDVTMLRRDLEQVIARSDRFIWIWAAALAVLFVLDCALLLMLFERPRLLAAVFTASGVGFVVVLAQMRQVWHEKFTTETVIALLPTMRPDDLRKIIDQLLAVWLRTSRSVAAA